MKIFKNPNSKLSGSERLFKNPILEKLSHTHIAIPISIFVVFSLSMITFSIIIVKLSIYLILILFTIGIITFSLSEYVVHRFVYHMKTSGSNRLKRIQHLMHGVHHDYPKDKSRLAMPPVLSIVMAAVLFSITYLLMNEYALAFLPGFIIGYAGYLLVHYMIHAYHAPKNRFRVLWIHHSIHHYKDSGKAFGVSSPLWDYIFGTMPDRK